MPLRTDDVEQAAPGAREPSFQTVLLLFYFCTDKVMFVKMHPSLAVPADIYRPFLHTVVLIISPHSFTTLTETTLKRNDFWRTSHRFSSFLYKFVNTILFGNVTKVQLFSKFTFPTFVYFWAVDHLVLYLFFSKHCGNPKLNPIEAERSQMCKRRWINVTALKMTLIWMVLFFSFHSDLHNTSL